MISLSMRCPIEGEGTRSGHSSGTPIRGVVKEYMVNQASEYALRAVTYLCMLESNEPASASDISVVTKVPVPYLQKVLRMLARAGILTAQRGVGGGFQLAKPAEQIAVLDVLKACDSQPQRIERCPLGIKGHSSLCPLHQLLDQQAAGVEQVFATTTIRDILDSKGDVRPMCGSDGLVELGFHFDTPTTPPTSEPES